MARPSKQRERQTQILDAYERCVVRFGLDGSTLQRIADEAGLARPLVRHHAGNLDALRAAMVERYIARSEQQWREFEATLDQRAPAQDMVDRLFAGPNASQGDEALIASALVAASRYNADLDSHMSNWTQRFVDAVANILQRQWPDTEQGAIYTAACGLVGLYFTLDAMPQGITEGMFGEGLYFAAQQLLERLSNV